MRVILKDTDEQHILNHLKQYPLELLLEATLSKFCPFGEFEVGLKSKMLVLSSLIKLNDHILTAKSEPQSVAYPRGAVVTAVHSTLAAPEFHAIEYTSYGPPTRWTGPSRHFSFDLFIDRTDILNFTLDFESVYFSSPMKYLKSFVDGQEAELSFEEGGGGYLASGALPVRETQGASVITFVCPDMKSPRDNDQADDRLLGVRFRGLVVEEMRSRKNEEALGVTATGEALSGEEPE